MGRIVLKAKALRWGNSFGFRIAKADFERARLQVGQEVELEIGGPPGAVDLSHLHFFPGPDKFPGWAHDDVTYLGRLEKLARNGSITPAELARERKALEAKYVER